MKTLFLLRMVLALASATCTNLGAAVIVAFTEDESTDQGLASVNVTGLTGHSAVLMMGSSPEHAIVTIFFDNTFTAPLNAVANLLEQDGSISDSISIKAVAVPGAAFNVTIEFFSDGLGSPVFQPLPDADTEKGVAQNVTKFFDAFPDPRPPAVTLPQGFQITALSDISDNPSSDAPEPATNLGVVAGCVVGLFRLRQLAACGSRL